MFRFSQVTGLAIRTNIEGDNRRISSRSKRDVVFGHSADGAMHECQFDFIALKAPQTFGHCFQRTLNIGFQNQVQSSHFSSLNL